MSVAILTARTSDETSVSTELARGLLRHHEIGLRNAYEGGYTIGPIDVSIPAPFFAIGSWSTEVISYDDEVAVLTWASLYGGGERSVAAYDGVTRNLPPSVWRRGEAGPLIEEEGVLKLGPVPLPLDLLGPVTAGAPALLTWVTE